MLSLRLKLENTERGLSDQRAMASELADRYGDTQRELARVKSAVQVIIFAPCYILRLLLLFFDVLPLLLHATDKMHFRTRNNSLLHDSQDHILTVESQGRDLEKKDVRLSQLAAEKAALERTVEAAQNAHTLFERQITELKEERTVIQEQLQSGSDSARVLDEYKKRAQMALKKVKIYQSLSFRLLFVLCICSVCKISCSRRR